MQTSHRYLFAPPATAQVILAGRVPFDRGTVVERDRRGATAAATVDSAQLTGHSLNVWTRYYARSLAKAQRDEARARMLEHGFGAVVADHTGRR